MSGEAKAVAGALRQLADLVEENPVLAPAAFDEAFILTATDGATWDRATDALIAAGNPSWHRTPDGEYRTCTLHLDAVTISVQAAPGVLDEPQGTAA